MSELAKGLLKSDGTLRDLSAIAHETGRILAHGGIHVALIDVLGEHLARWAEALDGASAKVDVENYRKLVIDLNLPAALATALEPAFSKPLSRAELAALAVYVVDIGEAMAFAIFGPELPGISAKADRSGGAARSAGVAKRLRG
ncbi:MAG: hypothetical protein H7Z43_06285 [Clostridia bacterium]|nr:hypothetical protein [Deltaproteobacteria bacterium]